MYINNLKILHKNILNALKHYSLIRKQQDTTLQHQALGSTPADSAEATSSRSAIWYWLHLKHKINKSPTDIQPNTVAQ